MFYDLGVLLKQKSTDLGTLYRQSIINALKDDKND